MRPDRSDEIKALQPKNNRGVIIGASIVAIVAIIALVSYFVTSSSDDGSSASLASSSKYVASNGGGITPYADVKAQPGAKQVDIYEDFQCPSCKMLERNNAANLRKLAESGKVKVTYHLMNFLDENLHNDSSTRAANAAVCAAKSGKFMALHDALYANQPEQEGKGFTDADLLNYGKASGLGGGDFVRCVSDQRNVAWVKKSNEMALKAGATATPTIKIDGKKIDEELRGNMQIGQATWNQALGIN